MNSLDGPDQVATALRLVGELVEAAGLRFHVVIIGGSAVNLLGFVIRATTDVDILACTQLQTSPGPPVSISRICSHSARQTKSWTPLLVGSGTRTRVPISPRSFPR